VRGLAIAAVIVLLGVGAVWVGNHAPVPSNRPSASELVRGRKLERSNRALVRRLRARERRMRALERGRRLWARRANRVCRSVARADRAALGRLLRAQSAAEVVDILSRVSAESRRVLDELAALPPPLGRSATRVRRMLSLYEQAYALDQAAFAAIRRGDRAGVIRVLRREIPLSERGDEIARGLDANVCADGVFADS
jgi:hypothetical protein